MANHLAFLSWRKLIALLVGFMLGLGGATGSAVAHPLGDHESTVTPSHDLIDVSAYFMQNEAIAVGEGRAVDGPAVATGALEALLAGTNEFERSLGMTSEIPEGTRLNTVHIDNAIAFVDLSRNFEEGGGSLSMQSRLAQVVYTVTQFPTVDAMRLLLDGELVDTLGGEGLLIDEPVSRTAFEFSGDFDTLAPAILVEHPRPGDEVVPPLRVTGSSNTFEATAFVEVVAIDGTVLVSETHFTASAGSGTRGDFDVTLQVPEAARGPATLRLFERSARDGSRVNITETLVLISGSQGALGEFHPVPPQRLLDTRSGLGLDQPWPLAAEQTLNLPVDGSASVPSTGVTAVALNVTVTEPTSTGFLSLYPTGSPGPTTSNVNYLRGQTVANAAVVRVGSDGLISESMVSVHHSPGRLHVIIDLVGWYGTADNEVGTRFMALRPQRAFDSRATTSSSLEAGETVTVDLSGYGTHAAYVLNLTAVDPGKEGFITAFPADTSRPQTSNLNFVAGETATNHAIVGAADGRIDIYNGSGAPVHLAIDVFGAFVQEPTIGHLFTPVRPLRVLDTRATTSGPVLGGQSHVLDVAGLVPPDATAIVANITTVAATADGFLTAHPAGPGMRRPDVASLGYRPGRAIANLATVPLGPDGIAIAVSTGQTHLVVDLFGWYRHDGPGVAEFAVCDNADWRARYPAQWHTNSGDVMPSCSLFDPEPITVPAATEIPLDIAVIMRVEPVAFDVISAGGPASRTLAARETTVDGRRAVRQVLEATGAGLRPEGRVTLRWLVDRDGETLIATSDDVGQPAFVEKQEVLDTMMQNLELLPARPN